MEILEILTEQVLVFEDGEAVLVLDSGEVEILDVAEQGPPGPAGAQGAKGDQGIPGLSGASFAFQQNTPAAHWVIAHNLNRFPSVTVVDSAQTVVEGDVLYIDANNVTVDFGGGFAGQAFLN